MHVVNLDNVYWFIIYKYNLRGELNGFDQDWMWGFSIYNIVLIT